MTALKKFSRKFKGDDGVEYREMTAVKDADFRLAIRRIATVQRKISDPKATTEKWVNCDTFIDIDLAAEVAHDSWVHGKALSWPIESDKINMPPQFVTSTG